MHPLRIVNKGFHYAQDGPGNRLVFHLFGCNLFCPWCANPETLFESAISYEVMPEEVLRQALSARAVMIDSGGVTFTGGEPTVQMPALIETLSLLRENDFHTVIQTNGTSSDLAELFPLLSLLIIDFKHYDDDKHIAATGGSNAQVIKNIQTVSRFGIPVWVRTPLINGFNADVKDIEGFLNFYVSLDQEFLSYELLSYHEYGKDKWKSLGHKYRISDGEVSPSIVKRFDEAYHTAGLRVIRT